MKYVYYLHNPINCRKENPVPQEYEIDSYVHYENDITAAMESLYIENATPTSIFELLPRDLFHTLLKFCTPEECGVLGRVSKTIRKYVGYEVNANEIL